MIIKQYYIYYGHPNYEDALIVYQYYFSLLCPLTYMNNVASDIEYIIELFLR